MKKVIYIFAVLILLLSCGCSEINIKEDNTSQSVTINMPVDDTVNGYRTNEPGSSYKPYMPDIIIGDNITVDTHSAPTDKKEATYCANKNSKVFHKKDCSSVKNMKEKNKVYFDDRSKAMSEGYSPCGRCNP